MKRSVLSLAILVSSFSFAQITQILEPFREVKVFDGISVNLIKSDENKVIITGEDINDVAIVNRNGRLKIRMETEKIFNGYETFVEVYFTEDMDVLDVNENAFLASDHTFKQTTIELRAQEGAELEVDLAVEKVDAKAFSGGAISTEGTASNQDVVINSGGQYNGANLSTDQAEVSVSAGGRAKIRATELVEAKVKAGGTIQVYGNPKVLDTKKLFGGKILRMD